MRIGLQEEKVSANRCPLPLPDGSRPGPVLEAGHHHSPGFGLLHYDSFCTRIVVAISLSAKKIPNEILLQGLCPLHPHKPFEKGLTENFQF